MCAPTTEQHATNVKGGAKTSNYSPEKLLREENERVRARMPPPHHVPPASSALAAETDHACWAGTALQLSKELSEITQDIITLKLNLAEDQFIFGKLREVKRDLTEKLAAERERNTELKKKLTQLELKAVR